MFGAALCRWSSGGQPSRPGGLSYGFWVGGTSLSRYAPHRDQEVSPTGKPSSYPALIGGQYQKASGPRSSGAPAPERVKTCFFTVARGPVPRDRSMARACPSPYVKGRRFFTVARGPRMPHAHPSGFHRDVERFMKHPHSNCRKRKIA